MTETLSKVMRGEDLSQDEMATAMNTIMSGDATPAQIAALLVALRMKGETVEEIAGGATAMREHAVRIDVGELDVVDTCGTGGDGAHTFNISTTAAFVLAGAGVPVAKHGNRAISSSCGSADVLAALGVNIEASKETVEQCVREAGIGFMFAPSMHPAMRYAGPVRKDLGVRTVFNMLGPLTNPARARRQLIGVFDADLTETYAKVLSAMGSTCALVVHGRDGLDEITSTGLTRISELRDGAVNTYDFDPRDLIGDYASADDLVGGDAEFNAGITRAILDGVHSPRRDIVCLNAAGALVAGGRAETLGAAYEMAGQAIDDGRAAGALERLVACSQA